MGGEGACARASAASRMLGYTCKVGEFSVMLGERSAIWCEFSVILGGLSAIWCEFSVMLGGLFAIW
eukprot:8608355-Pyramimonas_sp.AAC.2